MRHTCAYNYVDHMIKGFAGNGELRHTLIIMTGNEVIVSAPAASETPGAERSEAEASAVAAAATAAAADGGGASMAQIVVDLTDHADDSNSSPTQPVTQLLSAMVGSVALQDELQCALCHDMLFKVRRTLF